MGSGRLAGILLRFPPTILPAPHRNRASGSRILISYNVSIEWIEKVNSHTKGSTYCFDQHSVRQVSMQGRKGLGVQRFDSRLSIASNPPVACPRRGGASRIDTPSRGDFSRNRIFGTSCIVKSLRSRRSSILSPLWMPQFYGPTS